MRQQTINLERVTFGMYCFLLQDCVCPLRGAKTKQKYKAEARRASSIPFKSATVVWQERIDLEEPLLRVIRQARQIGKFIDVAKSVIQYSRGENSVKKDLQHDQRRRTDSRCLWGHPHPTASQLRRSKIGTKLRQLTIISHFIRCTRPSEKLEVCKNS